MSQYPKPGYASDVIRRNNVRSIYSNLLAQKVAANAGLISNVVLQKGGGGSAQPREASLLGPTYFTSSELNSAVSNEVANTATTNPGKVALAAALQDGLGILVANLVVNGDFATGTPNTLYVIPPGWDLINGDGNNSIVDPVNPLPPTPGVRAFSAGNIGSKSYLRQGISTKPGVSYKLSYYLYDAGNLTGGPWEATSANLIYFAASVSDNNTPIGDVISYTYPEVDNGFGWRYIASTFTATSPSTLLTFTTMQPPNQFYLTGISIVEV